MKTQAFIKSALIAATIFCGYSSATATTIYANKDTGSDATGDGSSGTPYASFHTAYTNASSGDTLNLTGTFDWTDAGETGDATITGYSLTKNLVIIGQGAGTTYIQAAASANTADRCVFTIDQDITLKNLTVRYGYNTSQAENSGGITVMDNTRTNNVTIDMCSIEYNAIDNGTTTNYNFAGGIYLRGNTSYHPILTVTNTTFKYNTANGKAYGAGALYSMQSNDITLQNCTFHNNSGTDGSNFGVGYHNVAGAIGFYRFNDVIVTNCTFTANSAETSGGAILSYYNNTYLTNNTIAWNSVTSASGKGGGVYVVFIQQSPGNLYLKNNIIANNTVNGAGEDLNFNTDSWAANIHDNGNNIIEYYTGSSITPAGTGTLTGDQASLNLSSTLNLNSTQRGVETLALQSGSVAINAGDATANSSISIPTQDQRGADRYSTTDIGAFEFNGTFLPVELVDFTASLTEDDYVQLSWQTATELNNDYFEVYRSDDGVNWTQITAVDGAGNSQSAITYGYPDRSPVDGMNYYQLRQVDFDGQSETFKTVSVLLHKETGIRIFPNPAQNQIVATGIEGQVQITDELGRAHLEFDYTKGEMIDISSLKEGVYLLRNGDQMVRFIKVK